MNTKQRDPRLNEILYPLYDEKRCKEIINDYELNDNMKAECKSAHFYFVIIPFYIKTASFNI